MRYLTCLFFVFIAGCSSRPQDKVAGASSSFDQQEALTNLKMQADELGRAALRQDHVKMADLTLPALVDASGGRATFIKQLDAMAADMKKEGFQLTKFTIGQPSSLVKANSHVYAIVSCELDLSGPGGVVGRQPSYFISVSEDGGARWRFIDGMGTAGDRSKLKSLLPDFPEQLQLPAAQQAQWHKE
jgi:hypothetical protein